MEHKISFIEIRSPISNLSLRLSTQRDGICMPDIIINEGITRPFADIGSTTVTLIVSCASVRTGLVYIPYIIEIDIILFIPYESMDFLEPFFNICSV
ncbi:FKBP12-rapamycin complex-associated protein [Fusarium oxysporum f. sp. albedinis]|nr:FKBP12-rapamycin complex-associated protein [Fusarium oxysporum f. sp. albedinis]